MYYKIHSFRKYTELCNFHHSLLQNIFINSKKNLLPISHCLFPCPQPLATINLLSVSMDMPILDIS